MKKKLFLFAILYLSGSLSATIDTNRVRIVVETLDELAGDITDNFDESNMTQEVSWISWTQGGFLGHLSSDASEQLLYREAFEEVVRFYATNDWKFAASQQLIAPQDEIARVALCQIREMSYTNSVSALGEWVLNPSAEYRDEAFELYVNDASLDEMFFRVTAHVLTNANWNADKGKLFAVMGLTRCLNRHKELYGRDIVLSNAVNIIYGSRIPNVESATILDDLFLAEISGYEFSSNRLHTIVEWRNSVNCSSEVLNYCDSITNQLLNAPQPLPEVEALRGL